MGVGIVKNTAGQEVTVISTSEPRGYLRSGVAQKLHSEDVFISGTGHAETDIINWSKERGYTVRAIGAGRPICSSCALAINNVKVLPTTSIKK